MDSRKKLPVPLRYSRSVNRKEDAPSFSSTLLDAIYRSIDEPNGVTAKGDDDKHIFYSQITTTKKKQYNVSVADDEEIASWRRACLIEKWMDKKASEKVVVRRDSVVDDFNRSRRIRKDSVVTPAFFKNSSSSSSDSSCGGGFSSSESDSFYSGAPPSNCHFSGQIKPPKPIRTSVSLAKTDQSERSVNYETASQKPNVKQESGSFFRTKSKALKLYSDLKKVKQPISPGGRLTNFLNSIFTGNASKKANNNTSRRSEQPQPASTCSSASSFSRSCLSKTPSSRGKSSNGVKRSVRFCPVSVIVDEDSKPCGQKNLYETKQIISSSTTENLHGFRVLEENRRVVQAAKDLLKNYKNAKELERTRENMNINKNAVPYEEEDDDDDLFELDHLNKYREELPVYETTNFGTNRAISHGFFL